MGRLQDKIAVIGAGGQAIGAGIAQRFAQEGARVVILDDDATAGECVAKMIAGEFVHADLASKAAITRAMDVIGRKHGRIDIMVIGAEDLSGAGHWSPLEDKIDAEFKATLERDVWGALWTLKASLPHMREHGASVIFIFSPFGQYASRNIGDQMISRWGALGLARSAANEWGRFGIRVNTLVPLADTPAFQAYRAHGPEFVDARVSVTPMKRVGDPVKDIGGAALFLASDDTRYVTGQVVYADGGGYLSSPVVEAVWDV